LFAHCLAKPAKPAQIFDVLSRLCGHTQAPAPSALQAVPEAAFTQPERVLLAEDNSVNQKVALRMLTRLGYRADLAANGLEVLDALRRQPYDIILMDVHMPEMDGLGATRRIRAEPPPGPRPWIIALTANAMQGDRDICLAAGMDDYISKPIKLQELAAALAQARLAMV
jgi:CheY-like chemotaxis protein